MPHPCGVGFARVGLSFSYRFFTRFYFRLLALTVNSDWQIPSFFASHERGAENPLCRSNLQPLTFNIPLSPLAVRPLKTAVQPSNSTIPCKILDPSVLRCYHFPCFAHATVFLVAPFPARVGVGLQPGLLPQPADPLLPSVSSRLPLSPL